MTETHSLNSTPFFVGLIIVVTAIPIAFATVARRAPAGSPKRRMAWTAAGMAAVMAAIISLVLVPEGYSAFWKLRISDEALNIGYWYPKAQTTVRREDVMAVAVRADRASDRVHLETKFGELQSIGFRPGSAERAIAALERWWGQPITRPDPSGRPPAR